jgi:hypothetical protein
MSALVITRQHWNSSQPTTNCPCSCAVGWLGKLLLALIRTVILGAKSNSTHDHILLSHNWLFKFKFKLSYILVSGQHLGPMTFFSPWILSSYIWGLFGMGHPFWWEDGSVIYSYKFYWALPEDMCLWRHSLANGLSLLIQIFWLSSCHNMLHECKIYIKSEMSNHCILQVLLTFM